MQRQFITSFALGLVILCTLGVQVSPAQTTKPTASTWSPDPKLLAALDRNHTTWHYREKDVPTYTLPDPLLCQDGTRVATAKEWEQKRRPETLDLFRQYVYGFPPPTPAKVQFEILETNPKALDGSATLKRVKITSSDDAGKSFAFEAAILIPNNAGHPVPAFLLINNRGVSSADPTRQHKDGFWPAEEIISRGYATAVFRTNDVDPDRNGPESRAKGVRGVWPAGGGKPGEDAWATISAWSWGASRVMDYLQSDPAIDGKHVAVVGHSRGGKTALWTGAQDTRFALAVGNDSGRGGASLARRRMGETITRINTTFPYWFCANFHKFNDRENDLPVDQHQLLALIAPRAVYVADAGDDLWADPRGEFLSLCHAGPVFALYNLPDFQPNAMPPLATPLTRGHVAYHVRPGPHNLTPYDWQQFMNFADQLWAKR